MNRWFAVVALALIGVALVGCGGFSIGINGTTTILTDSYSAPLGDAVNAEVSIAMPFERGVITPLAEGTENLFEADLEYIGEIEFEADGGEISLQENNPDNLTYTGDETLDWDIRLNPKVPLALTLVIASGEFDADLRPFDLTALEIVLSSGRVGVALPAGTVPVTGNLVVSSGTVNVEIGEGAFYALESITVSSGTVNVNAAAGSLVVEDISVSSGDVSIAYGATLTTESSLDVSSGNVTVTLPEGVGGRVVVENLSSGNFNLPSSYTKIAGGDDEEGTWETANFADAETQITLNLSISSGDVTIR